jgi:prepilin-type processing-associated H-X9-DG protein
MNQKRLPNGMTFDPSAPGNSPVHTLAKYGPNWIIDVLPQLEEQATADLFDRSVGINEAGANNRNIQARGTTIPVLLCPSDGFNQIKYQGKTGSPHGPPEGNWARGNYAASAGRAFIWSSGNQYMTGPNSWPWSNTDYGPDRDKPTLFCNRGVMGPNAGVKLKQVTDGTSKTIMIGEIRAGLNEQDARGVWALGHAGASLLARYGSGGDANGPNACYPNSDDVYAPSDFLGATGICPNSTNSITGPECMTVSGGGGFDQATVRSKHPGGVHVAMCDGSAQFIAEDIETSGCWGPCCTVWDWMILSADGGIGGPYNGVTGRVAKCDPP